MRNNKFLAMNLTVLCFLALACGAGTDNGLEIIPTNMSSTASAGVESSATPVSLIAVTSELAIDSSPVAPYEEMERPMISYLENVTPPCTETVVSELDPCMPDVPPILEPASSAGSLPAWLYQDIPSFTGMLLGELYDEYYPTWAPHIVIRGTVLPKTTRCELYPIRSFDHLDLGVVIEDLDVYSCFADVQVNEYIVGEGPSKLTVALYHESIPLGHQRDDWPNIKDQIIMNYLNNPQPRTAETYEGRELVIFLQPSGSISIETWTRGWHFSVWFVQRVGDEIRAVASDIVHAVNDDQRARLDLPLTELVKQLRHAAEERMTITGGRIGINASLPMFITDANKLREYYQTTGTIYYGSGNTTVLPPPVPGEGDPVPITVPIIEGTTVTTTPIPGGETTIPPSTDDAGTTTQQEPATTTPPGTTTTESSTTTASAPAVDATTTTATTETTTTTTTVADDNSEPVATETATGTTTTTDPVPATTEATGEDVSPLADGGALPEEPTGSTSPSEDPTTTIALPSDDAGGPEEPDDSPSGDDETSPGADNEDAGGDPPEGGVQAGDG